MVCWLAHDANLDRVAIQFSLDGFLERQQRDVNGVLYKMLVRTFRGLAGQMLTSSSRESLYRFSKNVFALVELLPMAVAFHGK